MGVGTEVVGLGWLHRIGTAVVSERPADRNGKPGGSKGAQPPLPALRVQHGVGWLRPCRGSPRSVGGSPRRRLLEALTQQRGFSAPVDPQDGWPLPRVGVGRLFFPKSPRRVVRPRRMPRPTGAPARPVATVVEHPRPRAAGPSARRRSPDCHPLPSEGTTLTLGGAVGEPDRFGRQPRCASQSA